MFIVHSSQQLNAVADNNTRFRGMHSGESYMLGTQAYWDAWAGNPYAQEASLSTLYTVLTPNVWISSGAIQSGRNKGTLSVAPSVLPYYFMACTKVLQASSRL